MGSILKLSNFNLLLSIPNHCNPRGNSSSKSYMHFLLHPFYIFSSQENGIFDLVTAVSSSFYNIHFHMREQKADTRDGTHFPCSGNHWSNRPIILLNSSKQQRERYMAQVSQ
jgi:hypothetical protein